MTCPSPECFLEFIHFLNEEWGDFETKVPMDVVYEKAEIQFGMSPAMVKVMLHQLTVSRQLYPGDDPRIPT